MSVIDDIKQDFDKAVGKTGFDPEAFYIDIKAKLDMACNRGGEFDPRDDQKAENACNGFGNVAKWFFDTGFSSSAEILLLDAWDKFEILQRQEGDKRIYKAGIGMYLSRFYWYQKKDIGAAIRWGLLTLADDFLGGHPGPGNAAKQLLSVVLGLDQESLDNFREVAERNKENINGDWSSVYAFPEDVLMRFSIEKSEFSGLLAKDTKLADYHISSTYLQTSIERLDIETSNSTEKGNLMEDLASYLFLLLPGWIPRRNLLDEFNSYETDIVVRNLSSSRDFLSDLFGRHIYVECKNTKDRVGVKDVGYFLYRMRLTHSKFGVIFSKSGITGNEDEEKASYSLIRKGFHEDSSVCIVINRQDLNDLLERKYMSFEALLIDKYERVVFGKSKT